MPYWYLWRHGTGLVGSANIYHTGSELRTFVQGCSFLLWAQHVPQWGSFLPVAEVCRAVSST